MDAVRPPERGQDRDEGQERGRMLYLPNVAPRLLRLGVRTHLAAEEIPQPVEIECRPLPWYRLGIVWYRLGIYRDLQESTGVV